MGHKTLELQEDGLRIQRKSVGGWGNARTEEGLTDGIHTWCLEFGRGTSGPDDNGWCLDVVCDSLNTKNLFILS